tara:strand:+ start:921 stop:1229 length:309 start_codon:yes stop_codon:yes gene_type:complete
MDEINTQDEYKKNTKRLASRRRRDYLRSIIATVKDTPCADCGVKLETKLMTFDHLPEFEKDKNINDYIKNKSRRKLLLEMAKCDVVCRPCHDTREIGRGKMC